MRKSCPSRKEIFRSGLRRAGGTAKFLDMDTTQTTRHEVEVDTALADLSEQAAKIARKIESAKIAIRHLAGQRQVGYGRDHKWNGTLEEAMAVEYDFPYYAASKAKSIAAIGDGQVALGAVSAKIDTLNAEFRAAPWSRFFLVKNNNGHIHSSMACSSCTMTTDFGWLPTLSGLTEADAVAAHGAILCTICFPSAPVEFTNGHEVAAAAKQAAQCAGSGRYVASTGNAIRQQRYCACPDCGATVARTTGGKVRAHKPKAA